MSIKSWHPVTRLLVVVGALVIPYLLWTGADEWPAQRAVAPASRPDATTGEAAATGQAGVLPVLPPLESFAALVERPLFSPTRRPPPPAREPEAEPAESEVDTAPRFQLVGTVTRQQEVFALILQETGGSVRWATRGEEIDGWTIVEVGQNHLVVRQDDESWRLDILR